MLINIVNSEKMKSILKIDIKNKTASSETKGHFGGRAPYDEAI